jgi:RNA polymerase sigma-B factor
VAQITADEGSIPHSRFTTVDSRGKSVKIRLIPFIQPGQVESKPSQRRAERETATDRLVRAYRERGDIRARDRVVQIYLPLVDTFARRYQSVDAGYDELMRAGSVALVQAIQNYVPRRGEEFIGVAVPVIVEEMKARVRDRVPAIATASPVPRGHPGNGVPHFDLSDERLQLASGFRALDAAEREIIHMRFVDELNSAETANQLGISREQLARQTRAALAKLRRKLERLGSRGPSAALPVTDGDAPETSVERSAADAKETHSGRLLLRMPPSLHTELAGAAQREDVSLNHLITHLLADAVAWQEDGGGGGEGAHRREAPVPRWLPAAIVANIVVVAIAGIIGTILLLFAWA